MARVLFEGVTKRFDATTALDHLDLEVEDGEFMVLLGPSGCGKTTALRTVAGLEDPDEGTIVIGDRVVNDIDPKERDVAMVFQSYALYPHLTVRGNIEFPLRRRGAPRKERAQSVADVARTLGLEPLLDRKPGQLSGGQRQRVALARAIVRRPNVFLMDEPLSNLDAALRVETRAEIVNLQQRLGTTALYVTHDQVEAMTMGHRIAVINAGRLQQVATPRLLYAQPANTFVAGFLGSPGMNLVKARLDASAPMVHTAGGTMAVLPELASAMRPLGNEFIVGVRPEDLRADSEGNLKATVVIVELLGAEIHVLCRLEDGTLMTVRQGTADRLPTAGDVVHLVADPDEVHAFDVTTERRIEASR